MNVLIIGWILLVLFLVLNSIPLFKKKDKDRKEYDDKIREKILPSLLVNIQKYLEKNNKSISTIIKIQRYILKYNYRERISWWYNSRIELFGTVKLFTAGNIKCYFCLLEDKAEKIQVLLYEFEEDK